MSGLGSATPEGSIGEPPLEEGSLECEAPSDVYLMNQSYAQIPGFTPGLGFGALPQQPVKRGPGRPRKDGLSPIARKGRG